MKTKKESPKKTTKQETSGASFGAVTSKAELKSFLLNIKDKMEEEIAAPIYALSAINHVMTLPDIYSLLDNESKELARDIWLRLKQAGLQLRNPPLLFGAEDGQAA